MAIRRKSTISKKTEKEPLMESGAYNLTIGWVRNLDDDEGFICRFDTDDARTFFRTIYTADGRGWEGRMLIGNIVMASGIPFPLESGDLKGARFGAWIEVNPSDKYVNPFYNFKKIWRCEE